MLERLGIGFQKEPVFAHVSPDSWYVEFSENHGLKLRTHPFYNPDFLLDDETWVEVTLSENEAYKKLFRYGHQIPQLTVIWLDQDKGQHKEVCQNGEFPNAEVISVDAFLLNHPDFPGRPKLVEMFNLLKSLKGIIA